MPATACNLHCPSSKGEAQPGRAVRKHQYKALSRESDALKYRLRTRTFPPPQWREGLSGNPFACPVRGKLARSLDASLRVRDRKRRRVCAGRSAEDGPKGHMREGWPASRHRAQT